jgi:hypothetical protein
MATRPTQLPDARAHFHTVLVLHDTPDARLAIAAGAAAVGARGGAFWLGR